MDIKKLEKQRDILTQKINEYYELEQEEIIESNKQYVGKTYKRQFNEKTVYYKILKPVSNNQYRFYTFKFSFPFEIKDDICEIDDIGFLCTAHQPFEIDDMGSMMRMAKAKRVEFDKYTQISNEEFNEKLNEWYNSLKTRLSKCEV